MVTTYERFSVVQTVSDDFARTKRRAAGADCVGGEQWAGILSRLKANLTGAKVWMIIAV